MSTKVGSRWKERSGLVVGDHGVGSGVTRGSLHLAHHWAMATRLEQVRLGTHQLLVRLESLLLSGQAVVVSRVPVTLPPTASIALRGRPTPSVAVEVPDGRPMSTVETPDEPRSSTNEAQSQFACASVRRQCGDERPGLEG